ncbi:hypothetical protein [uncultured Pseudodesulfovibrio sp.]|uniref:hypothetical protein n=1 Tax=uncultured Pseudodesulfovibrio sp. TaxID=2035858 RepID=UPI0029C70624|nr:hypothetical protein [uncultured Pseudodesulfovibrio sp.]
MEEMNKRERTEATIKDVEELIRIFNKHWLNHRNILPAFAVSLMTLIFLGMLVPIIMVPVWILGGVYVVAFVGAMCWRSRRADALNEKMEAAHKAFKDYERGRRKKK